MRAEDFFQVEPVIFILESPSAEDVDVGRSEGESLSSVLRLAAIPHIRFQVSSTETFEQAFEHAAVVARERVRDRPVVPTIHISAHGNEHGIGFTNDELVSWSELRDHLIMFAQAAGRVSPTGLSLINLCLSTCKGGHANKMFDLGVPYPCAGIIGPSTDVEWSDSLVAFVTLYHLTCKKELNFPDAITPMNRAAGIDLFRVFQPRDFVGRLSPRGIERALEYERRYPPSSASTAWESD